MTRSRVEALHSWQAPSNSSPFENLGQVVGLVVFMGPGSVAVVDVDRLPSARGVKVQGSRCDQ